MALQHKGKSAVQEFIDNRKPFHNGVSLRGELGLDGLGRLPDMSPELAEELRQLASEGRLDQVIYSYRTPIAWRARGGAWVIPDIRYSVTTSNHQSIVRTAAENFGFYSERRW